MYACARGVEEGFNLDGCPRIPAERHARKTRLAGVCHDAVFLGSAGTRAGLKALARGLAWDLLLDACSVLAAAGSILLAPANASFKGVSRILYRFEHRSPSWSALLRWQQTARSWRLGRDTVT